MDYQKILSTIIGEEVEVSHIDVINPSCTCGSPHFISTPPRRCEEHMGLYLHDDSDVKIVLPSNLQFLDEILLGNLLLRYACSYKLSNWNVAKTVARMDDIENRELMFNITYFLENARIHKILKEQYPTLASCVNEFRSNFEDELPDNEVQQILITLYLKVFGFDFKNKSIGLFIDSFLDTAKEALLCNNTREVLEVAKKIYPIIMNKLPADGWACSALVPHSANVKLIASTKVFSGIIEERTIQKIKEGIEQDHSHINSIFENIQTCELFKKSAKELRGQADPDGKCCSNCGWLDSKGECKLNSENINCKWWLRHSAVRRLEKHIDIKSFTHIQDLETRVTAMTDAHKEVLRKERLKHLKHFMKENKQ